MTRSARIALLLLLFCANLAFGQKHSLEGTVVDARTHHPVEYATLSLLRAGDSSKVVDGTTSDSLGRFGLPAVAIGEYLLRVEAIGYHAQRLAVSISADRAKDRALSLALQPRSGELAGVVVSSRSGLVENRIDKLVFNAEKDLTSQNGSAADVLKKVPQVGVDADGNVSLAGNSGIRFLIDGKPSSAFGSNIADVLAALPASQIKSIEVISNPGARYDAQGMGGIINIILKKSNLRGSNGTVNLSGGTRMENGALNLNFRQAKFGVNAFVNGNLRPRVTTPYELTRTSHDSSGSQLLQQSGDGSLLRKGLQAGVGFDWTLSSKSSLTGKLSYNSFSNDASGQFRQLQQSFSNSGAGGAATNTETRNRSTFRFNDVDASLQFRKKYARPEQELELEASTSLGTRVTNSESAETGSNGIQQAGSKGHNPGRQDESQLQVNYSYPLRENSIFTVGGKSSFTRIQSNAAVSAYNAMSRQYEPDARLSNDLHFQQQVYAAYAELSFPLGQLLSVKGGLRYERTERQATFSGLQKPVNLDGYNTMVPSLFLMRKIGETQQLKLSYARRIERPDFRDLNPFVNSSDPKNLSTGNPYLVPEIGNRVELGYSREFPRLGSVSATLFYRATNHDIQPYVSLYDRFAVGDTTYTNVSVSTRENIGREQNTGVNLFLETKPVSGISFRSNLFLFHRRIHNAIDAASSPESFNYRINLNASWQATPTWTGEFFGNFNSARNEIQGRYPSWTTYSFAIRKQFRNRKASIALAATNPFAEYSRQRTELQGSSFAWTSTRLIPVRSFGLNLTWKFGKLEFKKDRVEPSVPDIAQ
ncbi:TonB-dependent receptor [Flaviaesturariibacter terrae]